MKILREFNSLALLIFLLIPSVTLPQDLSARLLDEIRNAYNQLHYTEAELKANAALTDYQRFTAEQLTEIHKILAFVYFSQNRPEDAQEHFEKALSLTPDLTLDPLYVSPKILDFFNQVKQAWQNRLKDERNEKTDFRYVLVQDPRPAAAMRSMLLPGWGQTYKGEKTKGRVLMALWGVSAIGSLAAHWARANAENKYLAETEPSKIESRYNTFNTFHKLRNNLLIVAGSIWIYSYMDALFKKHKPEIQPLQNGKAVLIHPAISREYVQVVCEVNF